MLQGEKQSLDCIYTVDYDDPLGIDMDQAAGDKAVFPVPQRCMVVYAGALVTEGCAGSTSTPVVKFDKRPTGGSDTDRGDGDIGELNLQTTPAGKLMVDQVAFGQELQPGEEVVVQLTTAAVGTPTGHIRPVLMVKLADDTIVNLANVIETT